MREGGKEEERERESEGLRESNIHYINEACALTMK